MPYQYSLAHLTVLGCPPPELAYVAARAGYDYFSPRLIYGPARQAQLCPCRESRDAAPDQTRHSLHRHQGT